MNEVTLNTGLPAGNDWSRTLQNIVAYGAGRLFDAEAVRKIQQSSPVNYTMDEWGNVFPAGTPAPQRAASIPGAPLGVPLVVWLLGGAAVAIFLLKD